MMGRIVWFGSGLGGTEAWKVAVGASVALGGAYMVGGVRGRGRRKRRLRRLVRRAMGR